MLFPFANLKIKHLPASLYLNLLASEPTHYFFFFAKLLLDIFLFLNLRRNMIIHSVVDNTLKEIPCIGNFIKHILLQRTPSIHVLITAE